MIVAVAAILLGLAPGAAAAEQPNLVLITTDDQALSSFTPEVMPRTHARIVDRGASFDDAVVVVPLCCPSRATMLTGQYPHNHNVLTNFPGYGALTDRRNVLPVWLRKAGYRTAHVGKWLHGYEERRGVKVAPGWDRWFTQLAPRRYFDYAISDEGRRRRYGKRKREHLTRVTTGAAVDVLKQELPGEDPLYLQLDYYAPHSGAGRRKGRCIGGAQPLPRDRNAFRGMTAPRVPSFNEPDISDKPYFAQVGKLNPGQIRNVDRRYRCALESMRGVDRGIERIFKTVRKAGELRNTAFVFLTDNGFFFGEHRLKAGKSRAWEESIRTPLAIRLPRSQGAAPAGIVDSGAAASIDIAPTLLDLAGADPCRRSDRCRTMDGRSLVEAARGDGDQLEDRAILIELDEGDHDFFRSFACAFEAVRVGGEILIENTRIPDPETRKCVDETLAEHYDMGPDPFQLENLVPESGVPTSLRQLELAERLDDLRDCRGIRGRDPRPQGDEWCE